MLNFRILEIQKLIIHKINSISNIKKIKDFQKWLFISFFFFFFFIFMLFFFLFFFLFSASKIEESYNTINELYETIYNRNEKRAILSSAIKNINNNNDSEYESESEYDLDNEKNAHDINNLYNKLKISQNRPLSIMKPLPNTYRRHDMHSTRYVEIKEACTIVNIEKEVIYYDCFDNYKYNYSSSDDE